MLQDQYWQPIGLQVLSVLFGMLIYRKAHPDPVQDLPELYPCLALYGQGRLMMGHIFPPLYSLPL